MDDGMGSYIWVSIDELLRCNEGGSAFFLEGVGEPIRRRSDGREGIEGWLAVENEALDFWDLVADLYNGEDEEGFEFRGWSKPMMP